jgi:hypothetical protein
MAYTSSALSFLLEDLGKTVVRSRTSHLARRAKERNRLSRERRYHCLNFEMMPWTTFSVHCLLPATTSSQVHIDVVHSMIEALDFPRVLFVFQSYSLPGKQGFEGIL